MKRPESVFEGKTKFP